MNVAERLNKLALRDNEQLFTGQPMKSDKAEVDYSKGHADAHCGQLNAMDTGHCEYFIDRKQPIGECSKVEGRIGKNMWCKLFEPAQ